MTSTTVPNTTVPNTIFLDLDGVLADFDEGFRRLSGVTPTEFKETRSDGAMWKLINATKRDTFFRGLPLFDLGRKFFESVRDFANYQGWGLEILTACPKSNYTSVALQKKAWVAEHLCPELRVLCVPGGRNKFLFLNKKGDILIDDHLRNLVPWKEEGGEAIHHQGCYMTTLQTLASNPAEWQTRFL